MIRLDVPRLVDFCAYVFQQLGMEDQHSTETAAALVTHDCWGVWEGGTIRMIDHLEGITSGRINVSQSPAIIRDSAAWATIDGKGALGELALRVAMNTAVEKAAAMGFAMVNAHRANRVHTARYFAWLAANRGMIGIAMANDVPTVGAPGSRHPIIGLNPIAFALPACDAHPILFEMTAGSASTVNAMQAEWSARDQAELKREDVDRKPPDSFDDISNLVPIAPIGGAKGYGIGLFVEALSGILAAANVTWQLSAAFAGKKRTTANHGIACMALDPQQIEPSNSFATRIQNIVSEIHAAPTRAGVDRIRLPGETSWEQHDRAIREGLELPETTRKPLAEVARRMGSRLDELVI